jgi:hypothetical protein
VRSLLSALAVAALGSVSALHAQASQPAAGSPAASPPPPAGVKKQYTITPATSPIKIDGVLDEPAWATALVLPLAYQWFPGDNTAAPVATECLLTFDNENLYVAFRAHDPHPKEIRAHLADRDSASAMTDDTVGIYIDTFNDRRRAYEFRVNPLGVQLDATVSDVDASEDFTWDAIWNSAGRIGEDGYTVEMAIPLKQLRFSRTSDVQTWAFLANRDYPRSHDYQLESTFNDRSLNCKVCQYELISGFRQLTPGHNLELIPTVTATRTDVSPGLGDPLQSGREKTSPGISAHWGVTPNIVVSGTLNPDFSQVEADAAQLSINERFALLYPEKRPFFLEGADYFGTPFPTVFTRTVVDPKGGLKVTGKEDANVFGVFLTDDRKNRLLIPENDRTIGELVGEDVKSEVVRYRRDIASSSTLGFLYTGRDSPDYYNHVAGVDGSLRVADPDTVRFQFLHANTRYPGDIVERDHQRPGVFGGNAYRVDYTHATRDWSWAATYRDVDQGFREDSGFFTRADIHGGNANISRYVWGKPGGWFSQLQFFFADEVLKDHTGQTTDSHADAVFVYTGPLQSSVVVGFRPNFRETFNGVHFHNFRQDITLDMRPSGDYGLHFYVRHGDAIDTFNTRQVQFLQLEPAGDFRLGRSIFGRFQHDWKEFRFQGKPYLRVNLSQMILRYHFNVRTYVRAILQYQNVGAHPELFNDPAAAPSKRDRTLLGQYLFAYKLTPETEVLAGYAENSEGTDQFFFTRRDRTFFIKLGYAWLR